MRAFTSERRAKIKLYSAFYCCAKKLYFFSSFHFVIIFQSDCFITMRRRELQSFFFSFRFARGMWIDVWYVRCSENGQSFGRYNNIKERQYKGIYRKKIKNLFYLLEKKIYDITLYTKTISLCVCVPIYRLCVNYI